MTFRDIAYRNFRLNMRRYLAYFLCSSFAIMIFFMYSTLFFHQALTASLEKTAVKQMMTAAMLVIAVFSILFISYAHSSFVKSRNKEFGLFLTLGMDSKDISKIILYENTLIAGLSLGVGLLAGTVFARLFFMIVIYLLDLANISFMLSIKSYALTLGLFTFIFTLVILVSRFVAARLQISDLLKGNRIVLRNRFTHPSLGILGIALIVVSFVLLDLHLKEKFLAQQNNYIILFVAICLTGLYLTISQLGSLALNLSRLWKGLYFRNILTITEVNHKFTQNKKVIFVICILSAVAIYAIGIAYSLYTQTLKTVLQENPYDIMYLETDTFNKLPGAKFDELIPRSETPLAERKSFEYLDMALLVNYKGNPNVLWGNIQVISEQQFESVAKREISVESGHAVTLVQVAKPEHKQWFTDNTVKLQESPLSADRNLLQQPQTGKKTYEYQFQAEIYQILTNIDDRYPRFTVILSNGDYAALKGELPSSQVRILNLFNFVDWHKTGKISSELDKALAEANGSKPYNKDFFAVKSRLEAYQTAKSQNSFLLFIMSFIGLLFFISSGSVLYFKLYSDLDSVKLKYCKLLKIGIQDREIKKIISKDLGLIFYVPLILGSIIGYMFIKITTVNLSIQRDILIDSLFIIAIYFALQTVQYLITRRKHVAEILTPGQGVSCL